ncbi:MAG: hypothetical protein IPN87_16605 [Saprospiraceae bacterium]|nr:hypothetical protein [Candidatus Brachybacter algidus]
MILRPVGKTHTFLQKFSTTFGYSKTLDNITQVIGPVEGLERITVQAGAPGGGRPANA